MKANPYVGFLRGFGDLHAGYQMSQAQIGPMHIEKPAFGDQRFHGFQLPRADDRLLCARI